MLDIHIFQKEIFCCLFVLVPSLDLFRARLTILSTIRIMRLVLVLVLLLASGQDAVCDIEHVKTWGLLREHVISGVDENRCFDLNCALFVSIESALHILFSVSIHRTPFRWINCFSFCVPFPFISLRFHSYHSKSDQCEH